MQFLKQLESAPNAFLEGRFRHGTQIALEGGIIEIVGDTDLSIAEGYKVSRCGGHLAQDLMKGGQIDDLTPQVIGLGTGIRTLQASDKGRCHILDKLEILPTPVTDVIPPTQTDRFDGFGRLAGHPEVATDTVDRPWPQADARNPMILKVDAGIPFIATLEYTVVR
jgi:hypothetical protein